MNVNPFLTKQWASKYHHPDKEKNNEHNNTIQLNDQISDLTIYRTGVMVNDIGISQKFQSIWF